MPKTRFTEFPALSVDPRVWISRSRSQPDDILFFLPMTLKLSFIIRHFFHCLFFFFFDTLRRITTFSVHHSVFSVVVQK